MPVKPVVSTKYGIYIYGSTTGWGNQSDIPMFDSDGDGIFTGVVENLDKGTYQFIVREDNTWTYWAEYESEYDRTFNSQTWCKVTVNEPSNLVVMLDTNVEDREVWPVTYYLSKITSLSLKDELGKDIVSGYSVNWYDAETGELVSDKKDLSANEGNYYAYIW